MADSGDNNNGAPNVEAALATSASAAAQIQATRKPTIGQRKPQAKKGGVSWQNYKLNNKADKPFNPKGR